MAHLPCADLDQADAAPLVQVPRATLLAVQQPLGDRQTVALVATVASCNMVARFLEALHIHGDDVRRASASAKKTPAEAGAS